MADHAHAGHAGDILDSLQNRDVHVPLTSHTHHAGGDDGFQYWWDRLAAVTGRYSRVLMLGDSMGATAALLFSPLATAVHAFTPQAGLPTLSRSVMGTVSHPKNVNTGTLTMVTRFAGWKVTGS